MGVHRFTHLTYSDLLRESSSWFKGRHLLSEKIEPKVDVKGDYVSETFTNIRDSDLFKAAFELGQERLMDLQKDSYIAVPNYKGGVRRIYESVFVIAKNGPIVVVAYARKFGPNMVVAYENEELSCLVQGYNGCIRHFDSKTTRFRIPSSELNEENWLEQ